MKTFVFDNNYLPSGHLPTSKEAGVVSWYFLTDSALTNAGKPFFIPDFADKFEAIPVIAVKINRLGKSISTKFAHRYYTEYAPAIHFKAKDLFQQLVDLRLSPDRAISFDRALIISDFKPFPRDNNFKITMKKNGSQATELAPEKMIISLDEAISQASVANTLKMGDLIVPALPPGSEIAIGDTLELYANGEMTLSVQIK